MTKFTENAIPLIGIEIEGVWRGETRSRFVDYSAIQDQLDRHGFSWARVKRELTPGVPVEIVTPPMPWGFHETTLDVQALFKFLRENGMQVGMEDSSCHVNMSMRWVKETADMSAVWAAQKSAHANGGIIALPTMDMTDQIGLPVWQDVILRYAKHQHAMSSMVAPSRRRNSYAYPLSNILRQQDAIWNASTLSQLDDLITLHGRNPDRGSSSKFYAMAMHKASLYGVVEFRQHDSTLNYRRLSAWVKLLTAMVRHSDMNRVSAGGDRLINSPDSIARVTSRLNVCYSLIRRNGGATTREIMDATGCTPQRIRAMITEIRQTLDRETGGYGQQLVETHNQQHYGHSYGDSRGEHDLNGYEVSRQLAVTLPNGLLENPAGDAIWYGLDDDSFEVLQDKIAEFANR